MGREGLAQKPKEKILEEINKFRWEYQKLEKMRTPTVDDIIILQGNLADSILSYLASENENKVELKDCLLTDEEIQEVLLEVADRYYDAEIGVTVSHMAIAQAQLAKCQLFSQPEVKGWEETVIPYTERIILTDYHGDVDVDKCVRKQAKVSYEAGAKKVAEWIEKNHPIVTPKWQAQLKEWFGEKGLTE